MHRMHRSNRTRLRETTPRQAWRPPPWRQPYPPAVMPLQAWPQSRSNGQRRAFRKPPLGSLQEASLDRHLQDMDESFPDYRSAPSLVLRQGFSQSFAAKAPLEHFALEGEPSKLTERHPPQKAPLEHFALEGEPSKLTERHPPQQSQLDSDKLELVIHQLEALQ